MVQSWILALPEGTAGARSTILTANASAAGVEVSTLHPEVAGDLMHVGDPAHWQSPSRFRLEKVPPDSRLAG
jgi:hypothetical protein